MLNFSKRLQDSDRDAIVRQVAERSAAATLSQLGPEAQRMSVPELRGYVRAHAWPYVCAEAEQFGTNGGLAHAQHKELLARALEHTVHLVTQAYTSSPVIAMPMPH